jgi:LysM repeat protein
MKYTQQDVVVLTVLCNIAILAVALATANQLDKTQVDQPHGFSAKKEHRSESIKQIDSEMQTVSYDEIDRLLEDYIPTSEETKEEISLLTRNEKASVKVKKKTKPKGRYYIIQPGDSPWKLSKKFHIPYEKLLALNDLDEAKAKNLKIGQKLLIEEAQ